MLVGVHRLGCVNIYQQFCQMTGTAVLAVEGPAGRLTGGILTLGAIFILGAPLQCNHWTLR